MTKRILFLLIIAAFCPLAMLSQVTCNTTTMTPQQLLDNYFVGEGVTVSNVQFRNSAGAISSSHIGYFSNSDTNGIKIKATEGVVMATCNVTSESVQSDPAWDFANVAATNTTCPALAGILTAMCFSSESVNEVAKLEFDFVSEGEKVAFKYCFSSDEYPTYVCSSYNDAFGFFVKGPILSDGSWDPSVPVSDRYSYNNIALIPETTEPVTINSVNGGGHTAVLSCAAGRKCLPNNTQWFVGTGVPSPPYSNGCTKLLSTQTITVVPCKTYHMELYICNVGDHAFQSGVFLQKNSFQAERLNLKEVASGNVVSSGDPTDTNHYFVKGCSTTEIRLTRNFPAETPTSIQIQISSPDGAVLGTDYEVYDLSTNAPAGNMVTFQTGDTVVTLQVRFLDRDPNEPVGTVKTLVFTTSDAMTIPCRPSADPMILKMIKHESMTMTMSPGKVFCDASIPPTETLICDVQNAYGEVQYQWDFGNNPNDEINTCTFLTLPQTVHLTVTDVCSRFPYDESKALSDSAIFLVNIPHVTATSDKDKICEGEIVQLHATEATTYHWSNSGADMLLSTYDNQQHPLAQPVLSQWYKVDIVDSNGCSTNDSVYVEVVPSIDASLLLNPTETTLLNQTVRYESSTPNAYWWYWDFGDGTTATDERGTHYYDAQDSITYPVMLVAYNAAHCPDTAYGQVVIKEEFAMWIPTALACGAGNEAGLFRPYGAGLTYYEVHIWNRWGTKVFQSFGVGTGWDGRLPNGDYASEDTYVYELIYKDGTNLLQRKTGTIAVIRMDKQ